MHHELHRRACTVLQPGYYALQLDAGGTIRAAALCPWGFFCPGGTPSSAFSVRNPSGLSPAENSIKRCPSNAWTIELGATSSDACGEWGLAECRARCLVLYVKAWHSRTLLLCHCVTVSCYCPVPAVTPPGFYSDGGDTLPCPDGSFRSDWKPPAEATTCTNCGTGVLTAKTDRVTNYNISSGEEISIPVTTSASDCYIQAGQGLYYETLTQTWRAKDCDKNSYGVQNTTFGLTPAPCRDCE